MPAGGHMYAIIQTGGKQYQVSPGSKIKVEKVSTDTGQEIVFDKVVLFVPESGNLVTEAKKLAAVQVKGRVLKEGRDRKVLVFKKKSKNDYQKSYGHRQTYSEVEILEISSGKGETVSAKAEIPAHASPQDKPTPKTKPALKSKPSAKAKPKPKSKSSTQAKPVS